MTVKGKTASGFAFEFDKDALDNMELIDALADTQDANPLAISTVCVLLLGKAQRKRLYDFLRDKSGRVPASAVEKELVEIFAALGEQGKN